MYGFNCIWVEKYKRACGILWDALCEYADEEFYHAIMVVPDRPAGGFADDFSRVKGSHYGRPMPGKLARRALDRAIKKYGDLHMYTTRD